MVPKRKRNVKVDATEELLVVDLSSLDPNDLEEFALPPIDTGMEAEEEKELHLKKIIDSGTGNIPIPVIKKIKNPAKTLYKKIPTSTSYVNWKKDVVNQYCIKNKDKELCKQLGIKEEDYLKVIDELEDDAHVKIENEDKLEDKIESGHSRSPTPNIIQSKNVQNNEGRTPLQDSATVDMSIVMEKILPPPPESETFISPRLEENESGKLSSIVKEEIKAFARYRKLIRDEDKNHPSYVCFRRRVLKPSRKNRRSEAQTSEKIIRLDCELNLLSKMSSLRKKVCEFNDQINFVNYEIYKLTASIISKNGKYGQKKLKKIIKKSRVDYNKTGSIQGDIFKDILLDRDRIRLINKRLRLARENINDEEIEKEAVGYKNYLRKIYENVVHK